VVSPMVLSQLLSSGTIEPNINYSGWLAFRPRIEIINGPVPVSAGKQRCLLVFHGPYIIVVSIATG
jgi:hypothetical protein